MSRNPPVRRLWPWLALAVAQTLLLFLYRWLEERVYDPGAHKLEPFINEATSAFGVWTLVPLLVLPLIDRHPLRRDRLMAELPRYVALLLGFSAVLTTWNWGARTALFAMTGLGHYQYGAMPLRYLMEFPVHLIGFTVTVALLHYAEAARGAAEERLRSERAERALTEARLEALRLQLQPHFLFNALNTIGAAMYDDVRSADAMLTHLASLLRASLQSSERQTVRLDAELETLEHYVALLRGRFGDRFDFRLSCDAALGDAQVPAFVLQPLVENAVRHGNLSRTGSGRVDVVARTMGGMLELVVQDDGPGEHPDSSGTGVGLRATRDRLRLIHGALGTLESGDAEGGFRVTIRLPLVREGEWATASERDTRRASGARRALATVSDA